MSANCNTLRTIDQVSTGSPSGGRCGDHPPRIEGGAHADCDSDQDRDQKGASLEPGELSQLCLELRVGAAQRRAQVVKVSRRPTQPVAGKGGRVADHCDLNELEPERHALPEWIAV